MKHYSKEHERSPKTEKNSFKRHRTQHRRADSLPCGITYILAILIQFHKKSLLSVCS